MDKILLTPTETAEALRIGRTKVYALIASGQLPSIRIGSAVRVPAEALREWVERLVSDEQATREA